MALYSPDINEGDHLNLVQRLSLAYTSRPDRGFDGFFELEYMGSSEYEFGTAGDSLRSIRAAGDAHAVRYTISVNGENVDVWIVLSSGDPLDKAVSLQQWLNEEHPNYRTKEASYFPERVAGEASEWRQRTKAWWSFTDNFAWTLDAETANVLVTAFNTVKAK